MTNEELAARLVVLESFATQSVFMLWTLMRLQTPPAGDAGLISLLDEIRDGARRELARHQSKKVTEAGERYLDGVLSELSETLGKSPDTRP